MAKTVGKPAKPSGAETPGKSAGFGTRFASHFKNLDEPFKVPDWDELVRFPKFRP